MAAQWQAALEHFAEALHVAEETEDRWFQAETLRLRGDVLLAMGDDTGGEAGYRRTIAVARQQSTKLWELRAAMSLARLWRDQGKRAEAHALLAPVYSWFTEGVGSPVLQAARALLDALAAARRRERRAPRSPTASWRGIAAGGGPWSPARTRRRA